MTALAVVVGLVIGVLVTECLARALRADAWLSRRAAASREALRSFRAATSDEDRQRHLIDSGTHTLMLSTSVLAALALVALAFGAPIYALEWDATQTTAYTAAASIGAIAWWLWRARSRR